MSRAIADSYYESRNCTATFPATIPSPSGDRAQAIFRRRLMEV
jgi:hypothetical protein